jgi:chaperonin GroES
MSKIKPLDNRLIVKVDAVKDKTDSGILISSETQKKQTKGLVVEVGPKVKTLKSGDYITYPDYAGSVVVADGEEYLIMREVEVLAVIG